MPPLASRREDVEKKEGSIPSDDTLWFLGGKKGVSKLSNATLWILGEKWPSNAKLWLQEIGFNTFRCHFWESRRTIQNSKLPLFRF
ncbi:hypothetical protein CEXT_775581 [Caerostris extrusa]|uniref:Uncharacterized protein n=1 Tax=Caerostris extrusa TaxID=172846 RepID=A0AAV4R2X7_CAEEX|nr:hypothetical protein CEXT_775581 [Caerostris extrusa]